MVSSFPTGFPSCAVWRHLFFAPKACEAEVVGMLSASDVLNFLAPLPISCGRHLGCGVVSRLALVVVTSHFLITLGKIFLEILRKLPGFPKHSLDSSWQSVSRKLEAMACFCLVVVFRLTMKHAKPVQFISLGQHIFFTMALHEVHRRQPPFSHYNSKSITCDKTPVT